MPADARKRRRRKKRSKKFKLFIAVLVLGGIGGVVYLNLRKEKPPETFATVSTECRDLIDKLAETGSIELVRTVEVKSTISGEIRVLAVNAGDVVQAGQLMAIIEPDPTQSLQLFQKRSAAEQRRLGLDEQEKDFARKKSLFESKMLAAHEFESAQARLVTAENSLRLAELELEILETKANLSRVQGMPADSSLDEARILATIDGIVIRREVEIGEVVMSGISLSGGTVLFEIGDPSQMIVRADIAEIDIGKMFPGLDVELVVDAYPDTTYRGLVRWIAPVGQKRQGSTIVTFDTEIDILDHEPKLRQGMSCDVDIIFSRRDSALCLPVEVVEEVFDDAEEGEEVKGRRGRFVVYVVRPDEADSLAADSTAAAEDSSATADSTGVADAAVSGDSTGIQVADTSETAADTVVTEGAALVVGTSAEDTDLSTARVGTAEADSGAVNVDSVADAAGLAVADTLAAAADTSAMADSVAMADSTAADSTTTDSLEAKDQGPPKLELERFEEVELVIGLETSTRIEILSGLEDGDLVAEDPRLIRRKQEEAARLPKKKEKKGWF